MAGPNPPGMPPRQGSKADGAYVDFAGHRHAVAALDFPHQHAEVDGDAMSRLHRHLHLRQQQGEAQQQQQQHEQRLHWDHVRQQQYPPQGMGFQSNVHGALPVGDDDIFYGEGRGGVVMGAQGRQHQKQQYLHSQQQVGDFASAHECYSSNTACTACVS